MKSRERKLKQRKGSEGKDSKAKYMNYDDNIDTIQKRKTSKESEWKRKGKEGKGEERKRKEREGKERNRKEEEVNEKRRKRKGR